MNRSRAIKALAATALISMTNAFVAPFAKAGQDDDPCPLSLLLVCRLIPTAPDLDGDVDLTTEQPVKETGQSAPQASPLPPHDQGRN